MPSPENPRKEPHPWRPIKRNNSTCVYCAGPLARSDRTTEHLIGRRFVPRGTLNKSWNLLLNACRSCNNRKSQLEDDISAITMIPAPVGQFSAEDAAIRCDALRKSTGAVSQVTKRKVCDSAERLRVSLDLGSDAALTFNLVGPPSIAEQRVAQLAWMHFVGLFYGVLTYDEGTSSGRYPADCEICVLQFVPRSDWGNPTARAFAAELQEWQHRLWVDAAQGYFKALIRRDRTKAPLWAWAFEWNKTYRALGFVGSEGNVGELIARLPQTAWDEVGPGVRTRTEHPLPESEDTLFHSPPADDSLDD